MAWGIQGVEYVQRPPALRAGRPRNGIKTTFGVACSQGVEGLGMAGPGETLESPWIPLTIRTWTKATGTFPVKL
jgi:hypothetical protein